MRLFKSFASFFLKYFSKKVLFESDDDTFSGWEFKEKGQNKDNFSLPD
jgi:hypothetical protein